MSNVELEHLVSMSNQIADSIAIGESDDLTAPKVAAHIKRFWARSMKAKIISYAESDGAGLKPVTKKAISLLIVE